MQVLSFKIFGEPASKSADVCKITYIYGLVDPRDGRVRYVGKSDSPKERLLAHLRDASDSRKCEWLSELSKNSLRPILKILQAVEYGSHSDAERFWIIKFQKNELVNGNGGGSGMYNPTVRTRLLMRQAKLGKKLSAEQIKKMSDAFTGVPKSPRTIEHCNNLSASCKGRVIKKQHREKLAKANMFRQATSNSGFKGVYHDKSRGCYQASIKHNKKIIHLGRFTTPQKAALAWNKQAKKLGYPAQGLNKL